MVSETFHLPAELLVFFVGSLFGTMAHPGPAGACEKCGEDSESPFWDGELQLWRAKCSKLFPVPLSDKMRRSPHEGFTNLACTCCA